MKLSKRDDIRQVLLAHPGGLSVDIIAEMVGMTSRGARGSLMGMPDAYIARWATVIARDGRPVSHRAIWCVVEVPADAPHPTRNGKL